MKPIILLLLIVPTFVFSQKIEENKIDEFTKSVIKRTSWEAIKSSSITNSGDMFVRISKVNNTVFLNLKVMDHNSVFSVNEHEKLMIKFKGDSVVTLFNTEYKMTCKGCGAKGFFGSQAQGINLSFIIEEDIMSQLKSIPIEKVRLYTNAGFLENEVKEKNKDILMRELELINR